MRILALVMWSLTLIWLALSIIGAINFQELYGGWSGAQVLAVTAIVGLVPASIGWWAYRRSLTREPEA